MAPHLGEVANVSRVAHAPPSSHVPRGCYLGHYTPGMATRRGPLGCSASGSRRSSWPALLGIIRATPAFKPSLLPRGARKWARITSRRTYERARLLELSNYPGTLGARGYRPHSVGGKTHKSHFETRVHLRGLSLPTVIYQGVWFFSYLCARNPSPVVCLTRARGSIHTAAPAPAH